MIDRKRAWDLLEVATPLDHRGKVIDIALVSLIFVNVVAVILESVESLHLAYGGLFRSIEIVSICVFSVEYGVRIWSSVERPEHDPIYSPLKSRLVYIFTPMALIDLLAILPFFLSALLPGLDLRFIRVIRMARVFKLTRYSKAVTILLQVLKQEKRSFGAALFVLIVVTIIAACGIYLFEHTMQPRKFGSIPEALWWAVATLTTVGYGDVTPITVGGKIFGGLIAILGIGMVALPAGILASGFADELRRREREYEFEVAKALEDGVITPSERRDLESLRKELELPEEATNALAKEAVLPLANCPHCGKELDSEIEANFPD
jgi:voltage-gated potassium channel